MTDVQILDIRVPIEFYKALNPVREVSSAFVEARITFRMKQVLEEFLREVARQALADSGLRMRSGGLKRSLQTGLSVWGDYRVNSIRAFFTVPEYVATQEFGAHIVPRTAKVLCVPMPSALRPDGTPKRRSPAMWKPLGTFSFQSKRTGKGYLVYKDASGQLIFLYVYISSADIPARLGLRDHYRLLLPILMTMWEGILAEEMAIAYGLFIDELALSLR